MPLHSPGPSPLRDVADVVLVGIAARNLACAARRAGLRALVLDLFSDEDTRELAVEAIPLRRLAGLRLDPDDLHEQLTVHAGPGVPLVLGSGFEEMPETLDRLQKGFRLLGNGARTVAALKEPVMLDRTLTDLGIPHPRLFADAAPEGVATLEKRIGGSGGEHVRPARRVRGEGWYLQEQVEGRTVSALFLGNGREARLLAFSEQWTAPTPEAPYRYGGAAGPIRLAPAMEVEVAAALTSLVAATGLIGLASADMIVGAAGWSLIEINPRPGATLDVFDHPPLPPLLRLHIEACEGRLPDLAILDPAAVDRQGEHLEIWPAECRLQPVERRHLLPAGRTPGRPEIKEHHFAAEVGERLRVAFAVREPELRHGGRHIAQHEILGRTGEHRPRHCENRDNGEDGPSHDVPPFACWRRRSTSGRIVSVKACSVTGPICLWAIRPSAPTTKVSGTP